MLITNSHFFAEIYFILESNKRSIIGQASEILLRCCDRRCGFSASTDFINSNR